MMKSAKVEAMLPAVLMVLLLVFGVSTTASAAEAETPYFVVCGSMWQNIQPGTWTVATETAIVYFKSNKAGAIQFYGVNFERDHARSKQNVYMFPVVKLNDISQLPDFYQLPAEFIKETTWLTYPQIKVLAKSHMAPDEYQSFVESIDKYFRDYPNLW